MATAWLLTYNGRLFFYWQHLGTFLVAGVLPGVAKATGRWPSDSFPRYWCSFDKIRLNRVWNLLATSRNINDVSKATH